MLYATRLDPDHRSAWRVTCGAKDVGRGGVLAASGVLIIAASSGVWASGLLAMRSPATVAMAVIVTGTGVLWLRSSLLEADGQSLRILLWSTLAIAALTRLYTARRRSERSIAGFVLLLSALLLAAVLAESALGTLTSLLVGIGAAFLVAALSTMLGSWHRNSRMRHAVSDQNHEIEESCRRLGLVPEEVRNRFAARIVDLLDAAPMNFRTLASLGRELERPWQDVWVLAAILEEQHVVSLSEQGFSPDAAVALVGESDPRISLRSINLIENATFGDRSKIVTGDSIRFSAGNFIGAVGRNKVGNITSHIDGEQSQQITQHELAAQARELAATLDSPRAGELRDAADEVEKAKEPKDLRRAVHSIVAIATMIGEHGSALLDLGKKFLDGLAS